MYRGGGLDCPCARHCGMRGGMGGMGMGPWAMGIFGARVTVSKDRKLSQENKAAKSKPMGFVSYR